MQLEPSSKTNWLLEISPKTNANIELSINAIGTFIYLGR
jgi:hypothetical protein